MGAVALVLITVTAGLLRTRDAVRRQPRPVAAPTVTPVSPEPADPYESTVAEAIGDRVRVFKSRTAAQPWHRLANPTDTGAPLVFLVIEQAGDWLRVLLPVRPNGSSGWIRADQVQLSRHRYRIEVRLAQHRLRVWNGPERILNVPIAVGTNDTPTPGGRFYLKELLKPPNPNSVYGTYAYGLSGYSNVLRTFAGGSGVVGIHGTNDPSVIGSDVSHGCIRMRNEDIEKLVPILPLGTPVEILR